MGQVKIWLNPQPDISEIPKFLLLIMIIITVFLVIHFDCYCCNTCVAFHCNTGVAFHNKESYFFGVLAHFLHIFFN